MPFEFEYWCERMGRTLKHLGDLDFQRRAWLEDSIPDIKDSPDECLFEFVDGLRLEHHLALWTDRLRPEVVRELRALHRLIDAYGEVKGSFLSDPRWLEIVRTAAAIRKDTIRSGWATES